MPLPALVVARYRDPLRHRRHGVRGDGGQDLRIRWENDDHNNRREQDGDRDGGGEHDSTRDRNAACG